MSTDAALRNKELIKKGHPKGLYMLFMVEMWERFNFYGMRALLVLFMVSSVINFSEAAAFKIYGWFTALVYLTPVLGGWIADNWAGKRRSVTIGALIMAAGQFTIASYGFIPARTALFTGLTLIIIGNGFFKPNISSIVGELYEPGDQRRDVGFTIFYIGINLGAFIAPFITGFVGEQTATSAPWVQWRWGFMSAGVGMLTGLIWYLTQQRRYLGDIGLYPAAKSADAKEAARAKKPLSKEEKERIFAIFIFTFIAIFFWAFFEQAGSSMSIFAKDYVRRVITLPFSGKVFEIPASWFVTVNSLCVLIFAPVFAKMWGILGAKGKEPSTPAKFGFGVLSTGVSFLVLAWGASYLAGGRISMFWLVSLYVLQTWGELCLSPVGLSMVTKLAPARLVSLMMGVWMTASFFGNLIGGYFAVLSRTLSIVNFLLLPAVCLIVFAGIVFAMSKTIKRWMHGVN